jgi:hypothetical protein
MRTIRVTAAIANIDFITTPTDSLNSVNENGM